MGQNPRLLLERQKQFFETGESLSVSFRLEQLSKLKRWIEENENEVYVALEKDLGKAEYETFSAEIYPCLKEIDLFLERLESWAGRQKKKTRFWTHNHFLALAYEQAFPRGTSLILSPWNYPFHLSVIPLIGSIGAGNCVILKASEFSPHTSQLLMRMCDELFRPEYITACAGDASLAKELTQLSFDKIFFTGSPKVGKEVMRAASENLSDLSLELGGKSPAVLDEDSARDPIAIKRLLWAKFFNAGQTCVAPDYALVPEKKIETFFELSKKQLNEFFESPEKGSQLISRIGHQSHFDRLSNMLVGESIEWGGFSQVESLRMSPHLIRAKPDSPCMRAEIFGPILPILSYKDTAERDLILRSMPYPLSLYVFSRDDRFYLDICSKHLSGSVVRNDAIIQLSHPELGFGGIRTSGSGRYHGYESFKSFSHIRSFEEKFLRPDLPQRYWPYPKKISKILKHLIS